jgi:hypothetical protein
LPRGFTCTIEIAILLIVLVVDCAQDGLDTLHEQIRAKHTVAFGAAHYTHFPEETTWEGAQHQCEATGGNLVAFETADEEIDVMKRLNAAGAVNAHVWIGCNKRYCL